MPQAAPRGATELGFGIGASGLETHRAPNCTSRECAQSCVRCHSSCHCSARRGGRTLWWLTHGHDCHARGAVPAGGGGSGGARCDGSQPTNALTDGADTCGEPHRGASQPTNALTDGADPCGEPHRGASQPKRPAHARTLSCIWWGADTCGEPHRGASQPKRLANATAHGPPHGGGPSARGRPQPDKFADGGGRRKASASSPSLSAVAVADALASRLAHKFAL